MSNIIQKCSQVAKRYLEYLWCFAAVLCYLGLCYMLCAAGKAALGTIFVLLLISAAIVAIAFVLLDFFLSRKRV